MKVTSYAVARPAYYDRNATTSFNAYNQLITPAGLTTRFTYTVPAGKKLQLEAVGVTITTQTLATVAGRNIILVAITSGVDTADLSRIDATNTNVVASYRFDIKGLVLTLFAGETIYAQTLDGSTGGSQYFAAFNKGSIFDA